MSDKNDDKTFVDQLGSLLSEEDLEQIRQRAHHLNQIIELVMIKTLLWARDPELAIEALAKAFGRAAGAADIPPPVMQLLLKLVAEEYKAVRARMKVDTYQNPTVPAQLPPAKQLPPAPPAKNKKEVN